MSEPSKPETTNRPASWHDGSTWDSSKDPIIVDWERVRGQIEHEDSLINHRITWVIQINAMLLAAFGAGVYFIKEPSRAANLSPQYLSLSLLLVTLVLFGVLVSFIEFRSIKIANAQIEWLFHWWNERVKGEAASHPRIVGKPEIAMDRLFRFGYVIPVAFTVLWLLLGFAHFYNHFRDMVSQLTRDWMYGIIIIVLLVIVLFRRSRHPSQSNG